jgi:hypothetical protein
MGGIIDLLALLDGWDYIEIEGTITVVPGVVNEIYAKKTPGWLIYAQFDSTDAFTTMNVTMPPEPFSVLTAQLYELSIIGLTQPLAQLTVLTAFDFPGLPGSYAGFGNIFMNLVYPLPFKKENVVHIDFTLDPGTTQASATVDYGFVVMQILEPEKFAKSYKAAIKGDILGLLK